jgi:hypothetical protein
MFEPEDNLNRDRTPNLDLEKNLDNIDVNLSAKNIAIRKKQLEKIFVRLIVFGLAFGTVLGIGTYFLLTKLGLNKKPYQLEQERIEREKQQAFFPKITTFPAIPQKL